MTAKPSFTVVNIAHLNETQIKSVIQFGKPTSLPREENASESGPAAWSFTALILT